VPVPIWDWQGDQSITEIEIGLGNLSSTTGFQGRKNLMAKKSSEIADMAF